LLSFIVESSGKVDGLLFFIINISIIVLHCLRIIFNFIKVDELLLFTINDQLLLFIINKSITIHHWNNIYISSIKVD